MKSSLLLAPVLGVLLSSGTANATMHVFQATLTGAQVIPPVANSKGMAWLDLGFDDSSRILMGELTYTGFTEPRADLHIGACGQAGARFTLGTGEGSGSTFSENDPGQQQLSTEPLSPEDAATVLADLEAGKFYVDIHTEAYPDGELRGQIHPKGSAETCPPAPVVDAGTSDDGGTDAGIDAGTPQASASKEDDGCSTTGSAPGSGLAIALGLGVAGVAFRSRQRRAARVSNK